MSGRPLTPRLPRAAALLLPLLLCACPQRPAPPPRVTVDLRGDGVTFIVPGARRGETVSATLLTPAGPVTRSEQAHTTGPLRLRLPYWRAGRTPYVVKVAGGRVEGQLTLAPGQPVTPLTLKVGARGVRVTQPRPPALVLHPTDGRGNVTDLPVRVLILRPDGLTLRRTEPVRHLTAWTFLPPGRVTGLLRVTATTGSAAGEVGEVDLLPGPARRADRARDGLYVDVRDALGNAVTPQEALTVTGRQGDWNVEVPLSPVEGRAQSPVPLPPGARVRAEELP